MQIYRICRNHNIFLSLSPTKYSKEYFKKKYKIENIFFSRFICYNEYFTDCLIKFDDISNVPSSKLVSLLVPDAVGMCLEIYTKF